MYKEFGLCHCNIRDRLDIRLRRAPRPRGLAGADSETVNSRCCDLMACSPCLADTGIRHWNFLNNCWIFLNAQSDLGYSCTTLYLSIRVAVAEGAAGSASLLGFSRTAYHLSNASVMVPRAVMKTEHLWLQARHTGCWFHVCQTASTEHLSICPPPRTPCQ